MNCWEYLKCGRIPGGENVEEHGVCPAYPDHGYLCAQVRGTLCQGPLELAFTSKAAYCAACEFFLSEHHAKEEAVEAEEAES